MSLKPIGAGLALLALAACTTTAEERRAIDRGTCAGYGFTDGSEAFANCMMTLDLERQSAQRERMQAMRERNPRVVVIDRRRDD